MSVGIAWQVGLLLAEQFVPLIAKSLAARTGKPEHELTAEDVVAHARTLNMRSLEELEAEALEQLKGGSA